MTGEKETEGGREGGSEGYRENSPVFDRKYRANSPQQSVELGKQTRNVY
jgi:hypothetical protein